ncbi:MAG: hypothetical protein WBG66_10870, partial [Geitlerinemataceae cyanobacterium]
VSKSQKLLKFEALLTTLCLWSLCLAARTFIKRHTSGWRLYPLRATVKPLHMTTILADFP